MCQGVQEPGGPACRCEDFQAVKSGTVRQNTDLWALLSCLMVETFEGSGNESENRESSLGICWGWGMGWDGDQFQDTQVPRIEFAYNLGTSSCIL